MPNCGKIGHSRDVSTPNHPHQHPHRCPRHLHLVDWPGHAALDVCPADGGGPAEEIFEHSVRRRRGGASMCAGETRLHLGQVAEGPAAKRPCHYNSKLCTLMMQHAIVACTMCSCVDSDSVHEHRVPSIPTYVLNIDIEIWRIQLSHRLWPFVLRHNCQCKASPHLAASHVGDTHRHLLDLVWCPFGAKLCHVSH